MVLFTIALFFIILFIYMFNKKPKDTIVKQKEMLNDNKIEIEVQPRITTSKQAEMILGEPKVESFILGLNNEVFRDKYDDYDNYEDYSHLSADEARAELKERKENGEYLSNEEYYGYIDAINADKYDRWLSQIEDMEPKEVLAWFNKKKNSDTRMSTAVWRAVGEKVAPYQEANLLKMLENITGGKVEGWVNARKREGFFFTQHVYDVAKAKRMEYLQREPKQKQVVRPVLKSKEEKEATDLENVKRNIRRNRKKMLDGGDITQYNFYLEKFKSLTGYEYGTKND
jgi:hypothetical protein